MKFDPIVDNGAPSPITRYSCFGCISAFLRPQHKNMANEMILINIGTMARQKEKTNTGWTQNETETTIG